MEFDVTVESPQGTRNKYVMDRARGRLRLDRMLFTATQYPADFGFVEQTLGEGVDPLDALVLVREPTFPGCLIRCRTIGMFLIDGETGPDPTVICVPSADPRQAQLLDIADLEHFHRLEIQHFFEIYTDLDPGKRAGPGKRADSAAGRWSGRLAAQSEIERAHHRHLEAVTAPAP